MIASKRSSRLGDVLQPIGDYDLGARVIEGVAGNARIVLARRIDHGAIDFAQRGAHHRGVLQHLAQHAAVAATNDEHALWPLSAISGTCAIISW